MKKSVVLSVLITATYSSYAMAQATYMIAAYTMTCVPKNPLKGPDGEVHEYAPYEVAWDGNDTVIMKPAGAAVDMMGNAVRVERLEKTVALMRSPGGPDLYSVKLDFERGSATFDYGRVDQCIVQ